MTVGARRTSAWEQRRRDKAVAEVVDIAERNADRDDILDELEGLVEVLRGKTTPSDTELSALRLRLRDLSTDIFGITGGK